MDALQDAATRAALELQLRELVAVLAQLERARRDLVPGPAGFWRGSARHAYDTANDLLAATIDAAVAAVRSARDRTRLAIAGMAPDV